MNVPLRRDGIYAFGAFLLDPVRRLLLRDGERIALAARPFDVLAYLVANHDRLVTRDELEQAVWPGRTVENNYLWQAIYALRKALGSDDPMNPIIVTAPGRGYRIGIPVVFECLTLPETSRQTLAGPMGGDRLRLGGWTAVALGVVALLFAACGGVWLLSGPDPSAAAFRPPLHSIAVLAFSNLSDDPGQTYFSEGISEELIDALGRTGVLRVASRVSSFSLAGKPLSGREIGRKLNVGLVLEGSVRRDGSRVRITTHLVDCLSGYQLWSRSYDRDEKDIFALQSDIAGAIANSMRILLLGADATKLTLGTTADARAFDLYLRGISLKDKLTREGIQTATTSFERALALDPLYALAHAQLAETLVLAIEGFGADSANVVQIQKMRDRSFVEAQHAVFLTPGLAEAHMALAAVLSERWDFAGQRRELERASELEPNNARVGMSLAHVEVDFGHSASAVAIAQRAVALDPLSMDIYADFADILVLARLPDEARVALRHAEQLGFEGPPDLNLRAQTDLAKNDAAAARRDCAPAQGWFEHFCLAVADHRLGDQDAALVQLNTLRALEGDNAAYQYADIYATWNQPDQAIAWLQTAYRLHDDGLIDIKVDPFLDPIRGKAAVVELQRRLNLWP